MVTPVPTPPTPTMQAPAALRRIRSLHAHTASTATAPALRAAVDAPLHSVRPELAVPADPLAQFSRVMVVIAHPDDESMAGGTIAKLTAAGAAVRIVVLTNGDKGSGDLEMTSPRLARLRAEEMAAAAATLGATTVLLGYPDGELENTYTARMRVAAQIRLFEPQLLITFNPVTDNNGYHNGRAHRDHNIAGQIALDCFYPLARDHLQFKELWDPDTYGGVLRRDAPELADLAEPLPGWKIQEAYLFATHRVPDGVSVAGPPPWHETVVVDTTGTLETQARALSKHATQTGAKCWEEIMPRLEGRSRAMGEGTEPPVAAAEWFTRVLNMG
eukprot:COSAG04_NODE_7742_length_1074_cov_1.569231_1_plen_330_part_00